MASVAVTLQPAILSWLVRKAEAANVESSVLDMLLKWESGEQKPTLAQIELASRKTCIPFGYFFLRTPPQEQCALLEYRTIDSVTLQNPSQNLLDTIHTMTEIQEWMKEHLRVNGMDALDFVGHLSQCNDAQAIAPYIRKILNLTPTWYRASSSVAASFRLIKSSCQKIGVVVMMSGTVGSNTHRKLNVEEFRAFALVDAYVPLIFINTCDSEAGRLFSLVHEIVHIVLGRNSFYNATPVSSSVVSELETVCNAVASELLVPASEFTKCWAEATGPLMDKIALLANSFKCSRYVITRRALDEGKISAQEYNLLVRKLSSYYEEYSRGKAPKSSGGNYYTTLSAKFDPKVILAMAKSAEEGNLQYTRMFRLTGTNRATFKKLLLAYCGGFSRKRDISDK